MTLSVKNCLLALAGLLFSSALFASQPAPPIAAASYLLLDFSSAQILASRNAGERTEPASLTKLMTAYVAFSALRANHIRLAQPLPVSERAWRAEGSRMFLEPGKTAAVDELLHGMIVQSGNDASIALAEGVAGDEDAFVQRMNREAQRLGMNDTRFANATGLPHPQHYSTAHDLGLLAAAIIRDFPEYYPLYAVREYTYNNIKQENRNILLWKDPYVDGIKTGHTESAGFCLIASAKRGERRLLAVVLGAASEAARAQESQKLLNYGFQFHDTLRLYQAGQPLDKPFRVWKGNQHLLAAGFERDIYVSLPAGEAQRLKASVESRQPLLAPIARGQQVGTLRLTLDGKPLAEHAVVALESVGMGNVFARGWDTIRLFFK